MGNKCYSSSVKNSSALDSLSDSISVQCKKDRRLAGERGDNIDGFVPRKAFEVLRRDSGKQTDSDRLDESSRSSDI